MMSNACWHMLLERQFFFVSNKEAVLACSIANVPEETIGFTGHVSTDQV
jgi:hypothetical protein